MKTTSKISPKESPLSADPTDPSIDSFEALIEAFGGHLPPPTIPARPFTKLHHDIKTLEELLRRGDPVVLSSSDFTPSILSRYDDYLVNLMYGLCFSSLVTICATGLLKVVGLLTREQCDMGISVGTVVGALLFTLNYSRKWPISRSQSVVVLSSQRRVLIDASQDTEEETRQSFIRIPFDHLVIVVSREEASDEIPQSISVRFMAETSEKAAESALRKWSGIVLEDEYVPSYRPIPAELTSRAREFAACLGIRFVDRTQCF
jgi:hypothetical protein